MDHQYKQANFTLTKQLTEDGSFEAYVSVYNNIDFGDDIMDSEAFSDEPQGKTYPYLSDHDTRIVIGNWKAQSDANGLKMVDAKFNLMRDEKTQTYMVPKAAEKYANLKNGDITGFSVGYIPTEVEWKEIDGNRIRIIKKAKLLEGSVVTFPMNDKANLLDIKGMEDISKAESLKEIESILKSKGFSGKQAKTIISKAKELSPREDESNSKEDKERDALLGSLQSIKNLLSDSSLKEELQSINNLFKK